MDVSFNNVVEGTRQYFLGLPKQASGQDDGGQSVWPSVGPPPEEGAPAQSGAPAPSSRPPSAAASSAAPPRPPSEPLEPEPHIIHKATVMREAAEKRRELKEPDDDEDVNSAISPPTHIIHKPAPRAIMSPAPAPAAPSPSPARPPSAAPPPQPTPDPSLAPALYRSPVPTMQTALPRPSETFAPGRPPDPYSVSRPPEHYTRYSYDASLIDNSRRTLGSTPNTVHLASVAPARASPQSYSRISSAIPQHGSSRLRDISTSSPTSQQRYLMPSQPAPPPPHNDRVPPIHHPTPPVQQPLQRPAPVDARATQMYVTHQQRRETSSYSHPTTHYERHTSAPPRKYDHQQGYPGYRPTTIPPSLPPQPPLQPQRLDTQHQQYKRTTMEAVSTNYISRPSDRVPAPQAYNVDINRVPTRADYSNTTRNPENRNSGGYHYPSTSTSTSALPARAPHRPVATPKTNYEYSNANHTPVVPQQPARPSVKPGYASQQARMTVSVTSLVNQMNQTKQKRESPLDLSVKTVKNSADSSTTQDDLVDSASVESKTLLQPRAAPSARHIPQPTGAPYVGSHKVDFAPDFTQYRERSTAHTYPTTSQTSHLPATARYNGAYDVRRQVVENYPESRHQLYKYNAQTVRPEHVPRIDLTKSEERQSDSKIRDDRNFIIEERKRLGPQIVSNIPEKIVRYETWTADSRIDRLNQSAREQHELMSRPVYSYSSHKQFEAYQNEQKKAVPSNMYREHYPNAKQRHPGSLYSTESPNSSDYHGHYHDRISSSSSRHVIQKTPSQRDLHQHHYDHHNGIPADKRVLSLLRNSLETKQTAFSEPTRMSKQVPELIVIDDVEDEITDLTKDNESEIQTRKSHYISKPMSQSIDHHIRMPRAVDSIADNENSRVDGADQKSRSPENDVASRIRTKAELKVMPPSNDQSHAIEIKPNLNENRAPKILPKSQKQHLFNQIREDNLRLESVIKQEIPSDVLPEVKKEPVYMDEIEKDAALLLNTDSAKVTNESEETDNCKAGMDDDWANACDNFMEQLKSGCHKKKNRKRVETEQEICQSEMTSTFDKDETSQSSPSILNIKQEPMDDYEQEHKDEPLPVNDEQYINTGNTDVNFGNAICNIDNKTESVSENNKKVVKENNEKEIISEKDDGIKTHPKKNIVKNKIKESESKKSVTDINKNTKERKCNIEKNKTKILQKNEKIKRSDDQHKKTEEGRKNSKIKHQQIKVKVEKSDSEASTSILQINNKSINENEKLKTVIKEEMESTDDDEPLIKSKILKEKEKNDRLKYQLLKDLSEKSAYVKLECFEVDVNKNTRISVESLSKDKDEKPKKGKITRQSSRFKNKPQSTSTPDKIKVEKLDHNSSSDSEDDLTVATRLRTRKNIKTEDNKPATVSKTPSKSSPLKKHENNSSNCSTPVRKPGFGDASYFHPGWEEELYRYKRSLRMPPGLIAIPRGGSGGPPTKGPGSLFNRGSTSLPDLDPVPLSPAPSSAPSAATDDFYTRRQEKLNIDSDVESNSSYSTPFKLQYDSEASTSTVFSTTKIKKKSSSIVDVLIKKCGKREEMLKKRNKEKEDKSTKNIPKSTNDTLTTSNATPKTNKEVVTIKKQNGKESIFNLGVSKRDSNSESKDSRSKKSNTSTTKSKSETKVSKQRASIAEVFGGNEKTVRNVEEDSPETEEEPLAKLKKDSDTKYKLKKKLIKDKFKRKVNPMRDGLRSCSLKRSDAKGRMLRLKKRNSLMQSMATKRLKGMSINKNKTEKRSSVDDPEKSKEDIVPSTTDGNTKRRFKRLFGRRKFSSGFDYIRKKKKIIRKDEASNKIRRSVVKPTPESEHDIHKEIKGWFINKSVGETHLHRAARLGYTDCVAYCLEKLEADPSAKDNAGFTPLHVASAKGYVRIAKLLLQYGANVSAAAQGGIRPLHEAAENCHVEVMRLLLSYGADPLLGTYAGQTPEEMAEGCAAKFLKLHIADVQGKSLEPWRFPPLSKIIDYEELGCDALASPPPGSPPPPPDATVEIQCTEAPLPPFYTLRNLPGQPTDGLWCLLQDVSNLLQIKSKDSLLKQIHCGSGSPKELYREIRTQEFLERAQCHQLLCAGEKVNVRASKVALVRVTDKLRQLLKIETVLVS